MSDKDKQSYNKTLNLPQTELPMRAGLPQREPEELKRWQEAELYKALMCRQQGKPLFVLHDGPPYANGKIHMGTALNKILKDFIIRYKNMTGFNAPYVPGYDTHGLPTELKARKAAGLQSADQTSPLKIRQICHDFALQFVDAQREQFERLGVIGEWDNPYLTLSNEAVALQIELFGKMAEEGYIYKGLKPVYWCPECQTALAEAEIEYEQDPCHSIYVKFKVTDDKGKLSALGADIGNTYFVIWTTTTWTLPGNVAVCVGGAYDYSVVRANGCCYVIATDLVQPTMEAAGISEYETLGAIKGSELEYITTAHPFLPRQSLVIVGDHVTLESGTGCVHTAPGHGIEDFEVCRKYPELPMVVPVDHKGVLTEEAGDFAGLSTNDANKAIAKALEASGGLFALNKIIHQYPHCWRCKDPVLFRATEQCFCSIGDFRDRAIAEIEKTEWIPAWGEDRIKNMVNDRSDWCISRQRTWGVPIPIFYCEDCGEQIINTATVKSVADIFRAEGADAWYARPAEELLPAGYACTKCGSHSFKKETDIMDVWFDSGVTHTTVLKARDYLRFPADVYLEGADQYRGWFQSSLLTSVASGDAAPFKTVITHGWVVDGEGKKMSKSLGNTISPEELIEKYGADILRLWVASSDYHADIRVSHEIFGQLSEVYRKIRNTARFILGCLNDFDPDTDSVSDDELEPLDRWALHRLDDLLTRVHKAYQGYEFHLIFHAIHNFCVLDMSNLYLDVLKERLYVEGKNSTTRRAAQTAIYHILDALILMVSPILAYSSNEIWGYMPKTANRNSEYVLFNDIPQPSGRYNDEALVARFDRLMEVREPIKKALEDARAEKVIGASLDACVELTADGELYDFLCENEQLLKPLLIISEVKLKKGGELGIAVSKAAGQKCERCWSYGGDVGTGTEGICSRCHNVINN